MALQQALSLRSSAAESSSQSGRRPAWDDRTKHANPSSLSDPLPLLQNDDKTTAADDELPPRGRKTAPPKASAASRTWNGISGLLRAQRAVHPHSSRAADDDVSIREMRAQLERLRTEGGKVSSNAARFQEQETLRLSMNSLDRDTAAGDGKPSGGRVFLSHCWRKVEGDFQARKRELIEELSKPIEEGGPGFTYWADFLDLQAEGPVPWRAEIDEGIRDCSKFIAFVDEAWLTSYNCLQEFATAMQYSKPVVVIVIDQDAWDMLTGTVEIHKTAWPMDTWGPSLSEFDGAEIVPGRKFDQGLMLELFASLAAINLCPCRPLEEANLKWSHMAANMIKFISKDLSYHKEHSELGRLALKWDQSGGRDSLLMHGKEAKTWDTWIKVAELSSKVPVPTDLMKTYVVTSLMNVKRKKSLRRILGIALVAMILCGGIANGVLALRSRKAEKAARASKVEAEYLQESTMAWLMHAQLDVRKAKGYTILTPFETRIQGTMMRWLSSKPSERRLRSYAMDQFEDYLRSGWTNTASIKYTQHIIPWVVRASPDGRRLAIGAYDGSVQVYDLTLDTPVPISDNSWGLGVFKGTARDVDWSPDSRLLAAGGNGGVYVWQFDDAGQTTGKAWTVVDATEDEQNRWRAPCWSRDGSVLAAGMWDGKIRIWRWNEIKDRNTPPTFVLEDLEDPKINALAWSPISDTLVAGTSGMGEMVAFDIDLATGQYTARRLEGHSSTIWAMSWAPDGASLATAGDGMVRLWPMGDSSSNDGTQANYTSIKGQEAMVLSVSFAPDGDLLAIVGLTGMIHLYSLQVGKVVHTLTGHTSWIGITGWAPAPSTKLLSPSNDGTFRVWEPLAPEAVTSTKYQLGEQITGNLQIAPGGSSFTSLVKGQEAFVQRWGLVPGSNPPTYQQMSDPVLNAVLHALKLEHGITDGFSLQFSPDGQTGVVGEDGIPNLYAWGLDPDNAMAIEVLEEDQVTRLIGFSSDGGLMCSGGAYSAGMLTWNMTRQPMSNRSIMVIEPGTKMEFCMFHPTQRHLVAFGYSDMAVLTDATTGQHVLELNLTEIVRQHHGADSAPRSDEAESGPIVSMAWSPSGTRLALGTANGWLMIWEAAGAWDGRSHQLYACSRVHPGFVGEIAWTSDEALLISGDSTDGIRYLDDLSLLRSGDESPASKVYKWGEPHSLAYDRASGLFAVGSFVGTVTMARIADFDSLMSVLDGLPFGTDRPTLEDEKALDAGPVGSLAMLHDAAARASTSHQEL